MNPKLAKVKLVYKNSYISSRLVCGLVKEGLSGSFFSNLPLVEEDNFRPQWLRATVFRGLLIMVRPS